MADIISTADSTVHSKGASKNTTTKHPKSVESALRLFESGHLGFCVKNPKNEVVYQNDSCEKICGKRSGQICSGGCMKFYKSSDHKELNEGTQFYPDRIIDGKVFDIVLLNDGQHLTTILYEKQTDLSKIFPSILDYKLTAREIEILTLLVKGRKNSDISKKLFISKATLKTHINHIYRKLPNNMADFIAKKRSS